jgi:hypothetical protein
MSTRAVIARKNGDSWAGRFHHWDGYPEGLGQTLVENATGPFAGNLAGLLKILIDDHPAGWDTIVSRDLSLPATHRAFSPEEVIDCMLCGKNSRAHFCQEQKEHPQPIPCEGGYAFHLGHKHTPDPEEIERLSHIPVCYCHGRKEAAEEYLITPETLGETWCEYVYIIDPETQTMEVLGEFVDKNEADKLVWKSLGTVNLANPDDNWLAKMGGEDHV